MTLPDFSIIHRSIDCRDDAATALQVLGWIDSQKSRIAAATKGMIAEARLQATRDATVEIDGATFIFAEIEKSLEDGLKAYASAQRDTILPAKGKSAKFDHGEIRFRKRTANISLAEGETEKSVLPRLSSNPRFIRTVHEIDFAAILAERRKDLITDEQLAELGLVFDPGEEDEILICPSK